MRELDTEFEKLDAERTYEPQRGRGTPGKSTVTSRMSRGSVNIIFRVADPTAAQAVANALALRDGNGVAGNAQQRVDRAAETSGQPLPADVQEQFGASLGTDLSAVRVHTGAASSDAARAVGAKAYTTGQDIHFAAGKYDPGSSEGRRLLAHEVAHTAQQAGGVQQRQHELEVSSPFDAAEAEADRAADAMLRGDRASVSLLGSAPIRRETMEFEEDYISPSSQMRNEGEYAAEQFRQQPATRSEGASTRADVHHAGEIINWIEAARGPLGQLKGREDALNEEGKNKIPKMVKGEDGEYYEKQGFVPYTEGSQAIAHNTTVKARLLSFKKSAARQDLQHSFFVPAYKKLGEDFLKLKTSVDIIKEQSLKVSGDEAKADIDEAKQKNPQLAIEIQGLKTAIADMKTMASHAESGLAAIAQKAGATFDHMQTATDELKLPLPQLKDSAEQKKANAGVARINADLEAAKSSIGTIKEVVTMAVSMATGGAGAAAIPDLDKMLTGLGDKATEIVDKFDAQGAVDPAKAVGKKAQGGLEGQLASWITNYNSRIAAANGKVDQLNAQIEEKQQKISIAKVQNLQSQLADQVGRFALLMKQIEEKKAAVTNAAKKVQEQAKKEGKNGTNIGASAQAMADVSNFVAQADAAEALGKQEKEQGDQAQSELKDAAGDYHIQRQENNLGGAAGLAETIPTNGEEAHFFDCKIAGDADGRGKYDLSGYDVQKRSVIFTINEDDVDQRSRVMADRTDKQLENVANWKNEAKGFESELASALGIGPSNLK